METLVVLAAICAVSSVEAATVLNRSEVTEELIKNPRYLLTERDDGLFEVEDLHTEKVETIIFSRDDDITFHVYTPENNRGVYMKASQVRDIVRLTGFNLLRDTIVITHGWRNDHLSAVNSLIKNALLVKNKINIIVVCWKAIASKNYVTAQRSVVTVGNFIGDFLIRLQSEFGYGLNRFTLIGHSLGAHISGIAGARTGRNVGVIVGLDPAGPLFTADNTNNRLDSTDAHYVHVIHTNNGLLGFDLKMGHADYYPNGGAVQPGCGIDLAGSCAHSRAYVYYAESITHNRFMSVRCSDYTAYRTNRCNNNVASFLGHYPVQRTVRGGYYLMTNSRSLFARG